MKSILAITAAALLLSCHSDEKAIPRTDNPSNMNKDWIYATNVYEVNLRQYTREGTINAFRPHMKRLREMGVETIWFMPITPIAQKNKKGTLGSYYAAADYTSVAAEFGTLEDFKALVQEAHGLGLKVIIDWVANHTGWDHRWTTEHPDWYLKDSATGDFLKASGMDDIIELDFSNRDMRRAMTDAMKFWVEQTGIDGFRCDLAFWVELDYWQEAKKELDAVRPLFWLAEADPLDHADYMQVFDAAYTWTWMHTTRAFYQEGLPLSSLDSVLQRYNAAPGMPAWFTTNHDENTWNGTEYEKYGEAAPALAVFSATYSGIPLMYSGQELPNRKRLEFFEKDPIQWRDSLELEGFYKKLLGLRAANPALRAGPGGGSLARLSTSAPDRVLAYMRRSGDRSVVVLLNLSNREVQVGLSDPQVSGRYTNLFTGGETDLNGNPVLVLPAWGYQVYEK